VRNVDRSVDLIEEHADLIEGSSFLRASRSVCATG
jgi:hypothetical protein